MSELLKPDNIEEICRKYIDSNILAVTHLNDGHINDTYLVEAEYGEYICQRMQRGIDIKKLEHNYSMYSKACKGHEWLYPEWIRNKEGKYYFTDHNVDKWRMYPYIDGDILTPPLAKEELYACGQGLARMHMILNTLPAEPVAVYPHLHDLGSYYERYERLIKRDKLITDSSTVTEKVTEEDITSVTEGIIEENRDMLIEEIIEAEIKRMMDVPVDVVSLCKQSSAGESLTDTFPDHISVIHGDAKLSNMLFERAPFRCGMRRVIGFIDMDTVMPGSWLADIADCIRSCCLTNESAEKSSARSFDCDAAEHLISGYVSIAGRKTEDALRNSLPAVFDRICFELALRYYTDAISGAENERVFKEKYPGYLLGRARELFGISWGETTLK